MVRLFIVPEAAAGMRSGIAWASALRSTSTMRCEVSTLPPATAAGGLALTTVPAGAITLIGRIRPAVAGALVAGEQCDEAKPAHARQGSGDLVTPSRHRVQAGRDKLG